MVEFFKMESIVGTGHRIYDVLSKLKILWKAKLFSNIKFKSIERKEVITSFARTIVFL